VLKCYICFRNQSEFNYSNIYYIAESFFVPFKNYFSKQKIVITYLFFFALVFNLIFHIYQRSEYIEYWSSKHKITKKKLLAITEGKGIIIFWDGSPGLLVGEESFHLWGNYRYGNEIFDEELGNSFPKFRWLRARHLRKLGNNNFSKDEQIIDEIFFKEGINLNEPLLFAIRKSEYAHELSNVSISIFVKFLDQKNKSTYYWEEKIANDQWLFIRLS